MLPKDTVLPLVTVEAPRWDRLCYYCCKATRRRVRLRTPMSNGGLDIGFTGSFVGGAMVDPSVTAVTR
jgi:hypothetical protein